MTDRELEQAEILRLEKKCAALLAEIIELAETGILPDGDGVDTPVKLWAESVVERFGTSAQEYEQQIRTDERERAIRIARVTLRDCEESEYPVRFQALFSRRLYSSSDELIGTEQEV